jgi:DNA-binding MarR family transcriptional regulator
MSKSWTFLSHHAHVLIALDRDPNCTIDHLAGILGVTSRSVVNVLNDLVGDGYLSKSKDGRNNRYQINRDAPLRHETSQGRTVGDLIESLGKFS